MEFLSLTSDLIEKDGGGLENDTHDVPLLHVRVGYTDDDIISDVTGGTDLERSITESRVQERREAFLLASRPIAMEHRVMVNGALDWCAKEFAESQSRDRSLDEILKST